MAQRAPAEVTVSATDAKNKFGFLLSQVADTGEAVIVERQGKPRAAIISMDDYRQFREAQEKLRRQRALEALQKLQAEVSAQFADWTDEQKDALAQEIRDEVWTNLAKKNRALSADAS
jgi:prevent-host-death family protein